MTATDITMPEAAPANTRGGGKLKNARLRNERQLRSFQDIMEKTAAPLQRTAGEGKRISLNTSLEAARASLSGDAESHPKVMATGQFQVLTGAQQKRLIQDDADEFDTAGKPTEVEDEITGEGTNAETVSVKLEKVIAGLLPPQQPVAAVPSARPVERAAVADVADAANRETMLQPSRAAMPPVILPQSERAKASETVKMPEFPNVEAKPQPVPRMEEVVSAPRVAARAEQDQPPTQALRTETLTVTRLETVLLPAGNGFGQPAIKTEPVQSPAPLAPAAPALPAPPAQAVVKTIEFRLQPDELGPVKVALHMRGEELRVQVEVTTRQGHAALQQDKGILASVLEKAGYDLSEAALTITLRADPQPAPAASTNNDSQAFARNSGGNSGETFQNSANGEHSRHATRHPEREEHHGRKSAIQPGEAVPPSASGGIYL
jgi:hypothetical protein